MVTAAPTATHVEVRVLLVAAVSSGQGKTTVTAALARKLVQQGRRVRVFKCGPDFIDPMLLERASGAPVHSLDLWMVGAEHCRQQLARAAREADVILIEGVMGLYDGTPSSAELARAFGFPVMAVIDASAMAQTAGALVLGLRDYGPVEMAGVIANRVASPGHAAMVAASLREIPLFATLARQSRSMPERHLGLVLPGEVLDIDAMLDELAEQLAFDAAAWSRLRTTRIELPPEAPAIVPALADSLSDQKGEQWTMAGVLPGRVLMQARLAGLGSQGLATPQGVLRGHTFHYSRLETQLAAAAHTVKHPSGAAGEALYRVGSLSASYFHAYFPSNPAAAAALFQPAAA